MERRIVKLACLALILGAGLGPGLSGCSGEAGPVAADHAAAPSGWVAPPRITTVETIPSGLRFTGMAEPGARVVLRAATGDGAFAAGADDQGRFDLRMAPPSGESLFIPEVQFGESAAQGRERLLILDGGKGPVVVLPVGGGARRLDRAPALAAVDSDGQALVLSGPAAPDATVAVTVRGVTRSVGADASGRWSLLVSGGGPADIRVGSRDFAYPGGDVGAGVMARRAGLGWLASWAAPGGATQTVWLPDHG